MREQQRDGFVSREDAESRAIERLALIDDRSDHRQYRVPTRRRRPIDRAMLPVAHSPREDNSPGASPPGNTHSRLSV